MNTHSKGNERYSLTPDVMSLTLWNTKTQTADDPQANVVTNSAVKPSWASGEAAAMCAAERERLLTEHLPSVRYIARRIHERMPQHVELEDLVSAGIVGLIDAFNKFDHNKKVQFKSYAQFRIRGAILDSLRVLDWGPRELRRKGRAVQDATHALTRTLHRAPTEQEVADEMQITLAQYQTLLGNLKGLEIGSLHVDHTEDSGEEELAYVAGPAEDSPLFLCLQGEKRQRLMDAIEELPEKERMVLTLYYYEELTMKEIGSAIGVVESRVSQIHTSALNRLRAILRSENSGASHRSYPTQTRHVPTSASRRVSTSLPC
jgi:RNA polymerase sigma factor for flagellar operon FliA